MGQASPLSLRPQPLDLGKDHDWKTWTNNLVPTHVWEHKCRHLHAQIDQGGIHTQLAVDAGGNRGHDHHYCASISIDKTVVVNYLLGNCCWQNAVDAKFLRQWTQDRRPADLHIT